MINLVDALQIQASRHAVWHHFSDIAAWPQWNREVLAAEWETGTPWSEGATFAVEHFTLGGARRKTLYTVRMHIHQQRAVYESVTQFPLTMISSVHLTDSLGGCRLEATHSYTGPASILVWLLQARQKRLLRNAMLALKAQVEGPARK